MDYNDSYTNLIQYKNDVPEVCCCYHSEFDSWRDWNVDDDSHDRSCPMSKPPKKVSCIIDVRVVGNPIRFRFKECDFSVRIYSASTEHEYDEGPILAEEEGISLLHELTLAAVVDIKDIDQDYISILKKYNCLDVNVWTPVYVTGPFNAPSSRDTYWQEFYNRYKSHMNVQQKREQSENAHIKPKQKKNKK